MKWRARISLAAALPLLFASAAAATPPPIPYCTLHPRLCHPVDPATRAHFLGMMQRVIRAVPKVPDYRCAVARREINEVGYGRSERRAVPKWMLANMWCFHRGADRRKAQPDVTIDVELSTLPAVAGEGASQEKQRDPFMFVEPKGIRLVFGKVRLAALFHNSEQEMVDNGPYLTSVQVVIRAESPAAVAAFADRFDRTALSRLMAGEERRRKADHQARPIANAVP